MVSNMVDDFLVSETWTSDCEEFIVGTMLDDTDNLVFCLEIDDYEIASIILDRSNVESLVDFLAEWTGFPMFVGGDPLGVTDERK